MTLLELLNLVREHLKLVIMLPVVCALITGAVSYLYLPDVYTATASMYVYIQDESSSSTSTSTDLSASQMIANDVATLLTSDRLQSDTAEDLQMSSLSDYTLSVTSSTSTRIITLSVTGQDAASTATIANTLTQNVSTVAQEVMGVESVNAIDEATTPTSPSGPNRIMYIAVAFLAGLFLAVAIVVLMDMLNTKIRSTEEIEELLGVPVIGRIPVMRG